MKLIFSDRKKGIKKLRVDSPNDMWHLSNVINKGDTVEAKTFRAVKFGTKEERKPVFIGISVESVEFSKLKKSLRITGKILYGSPEEFIQKGRYHTIEVKEGDIITIIKNWLNYEEARIREAIEESKKPRAVIVLVEESKMLVAHVLSYGIETEEISFFKSKKDNSVLQENDFDFLLRIDKSLIIIVAGPGFAKLKVADFLKKHGYHVVVEEASYAEISGIVELVEKGVINNVISQHRFDTESKLIGEFEMHLFKEDGLSAYGKQEVLKAINSSAVEKLLIVDDLITNEEFHKIAKLSEEQGAKVYVISSTTPWGKKLSGYGGIAAILRFPIK